MLTYLVQTLDEISLITCQLVHRLTGEGAAFDNHLLARVSYSYIKLLQHICRIT